MAFPALVPSSRSFSPGNWPVKTFRSQDGSETRILYGTKRTGMTLELRYKNITDANAELFLDDYILQKGTYKTFSLGDSGDEVRGGWEGTAAAISNGYNTTDAAGNEWRYAEAPKVTQVAKGISNVQVKLLGVL